MKDLLQSASSDFAEVYEVDRTAVVWIGNDKYRIEVLKAHHLGPGNEIYRVDVYCQVEIETQGVMKELDGSEKETTLKQYTWVQYTNFPDVQEDRSDEAMLKSLHWLHERHA